MSSELTYINSNKPQNKQGTTKKSTAKIHSPTLTSINMVIDALKTHKEFSSKQQLLRALPKQIRHSTFVGILDFLYNYNMIEFEGNSIIWIFDFLARNKKHNDTFIENVRKYNLDKLIEENQESLNNSDKIKYGVTTIHLDSLKEKSENE